MRSPSLYRICGGSLIAAALLFTISALLAPISPDHSLTALKPLVGGSWIGAAWLGILGFPLALGALLGLYRHFTGSDQEGWAAIMLGTFVLGATLLVLCQALTGIGQAMLLAQAGTPAEIAALEPSQTALVAVITGAYVAGGALTWLTLVPMAVALIGDSAWPRLVAWGALPVFVVEEALGMAFQTGPWMRLGTILGFAYLALLGSTFMRFGRTAAAVPHAPSVAGV